MMVVTVIAVWLEAVAVKNSMMNIKQDRIPKSLSRPKVGFNRLMAVRAKIHVVLNASYAVVSVIYVVLSTFHVVVSADVSIVPCCPYT